MRRVRGIVTEEKLAEWYTRCLRGKQAHILAAKLLEKLSSELEREFPQAAGVVDFLKERRYMEILSPERWDVDVLQDIQESEDTESIEYHPRSQPPNTIYEYLEE